MFTDSEPQPLDEKRQRSKPVLTTGILSATAVLAWLIPIVLIFVDDLPRGLYALTGGLAVTVTMCAAGVGVMWWSRSAREAAGRESAARYDALIRLVAHNHMETQRGLAELVHHLDRELRQVTAQHNRTEWNRYAEGVMDAVGGPDVVDGTSTRPLNMANVVSMPRTRNGRN